MSNHQTKLTANIDAGVIEFYGYRLNLVVDGPPIPKSLRDQLQQMLIDAASYRSYDEGYKEGYADGHSDAEYEADEDE